MKKQKDVIKEVMCGNGNGYTVKELLNAHIRDGKNFENYVRERFVEGVGKIAGNRIRSKIALTGVYVLFVAIVGGAVTIVRLWLTTKP